MPRYDDAPWVQLTARIPENLHRSLKVHCVETDSSQMQFRS